MTTIFSPITAIYGSSVAVIRISGSKTSEILKILGFKGEPTHQKASLQRIYNPKTKELLDECLISFFKNPHSFTGEDIAEISLHASPFIVRKLCEILSEIDNCRLAEAGEFSKIAFLNNKLDLVKAEAIPDLIASETQAQHQQSILQLQGKLGEIYENWCTRLIEISALIEALIDFPEDDLPQNIIDDIEKKVFNLKQEIKLHLNDGKVGQKIKNGINLAIIGAPNVGKSSLINFLAKSDVAIVSEIAGTTRDVVETYLDISGYQVKISDTAGIRKTEDKIEQAGIDRALKKAFEADIKILLFDASNPIIDKNLLDNNTILIANKQDLINNETIQADLVISIKNGLNTDKIFTILSEKIRNITPKTNSALITQERYRSALNKSLENLENFSLQKGVEFGAEDLRLALFEIGKITGKVDVEKILDVIFSKFCIGK